MVRVEVSDDYSHDRQPVELLGKDLFPQLFCSGCCVASIDNRPTRAVFEQPKVDVVESEGQGHAQPFYPGGDCERLTGSWWRCNRKLQRCQASVHNRGISRVAN